MPQIMDARSSTEVGSGVETGTPGTSLAPFAIPNENVALVIDVLEVTPVTARVNVAAFAVLGRSSWMPRNTLSAKQYSGSKSGSISACHAKIAKHMSACPNLE